MNIRYVVTCIKKDGLRAMMAAVQGRNTHATITEAQKDLNNVLTNNSKETLISCFGPQCIDTFKVSPVDCYPIHNDPKRYYIEEVI